MKSALYVFLLSALFSLSAQARCTFDWNNGARCDNSSGQTPAFDRSGSVCISPWSDIDPEGSYAEARRMADDAADEACAPAGTAKRTSAYREQEDYRCGHGQKRYASSASYTCVQN